MKYRIVTRRLMIWSQRIGIISIIFSLYWINLNWTLTAIWSRI